MAAEKYPFKAFIEEDKNRYPLASEKGYYDPYNHFRIGDSGGFIMNIKPGKFVNVHLLTEMADFFEAELTAGNRIIMCSDGLSNMVDDGEIEQILSLNLPIEDKAKRLIDMANESGGADNIAVVIVEL